MHTESHPLAGQTVKVKDYPTLERHLTPRFPGRSTGSRTGGTSSLAVVGCSPTEIRLRVQLKKERWSEHDQGTYLTLFISPDKSKEGT